MELKNKKYSREEVYAMCNAYRGVYEKQIRELKSRIDEIVKEKNDIQAQLDLIKDKELLIAKTLERVEEIADRLKKQAEIEYSLELENLKKFVEINDKFFKELENSSSVKAKKAIAVKDKVKKSKSDKSAKKIIEEIEQIETDKKSKKVKKESFNPKSKIGEYIASTSDGFNMEEVLNPGELALEDICKELGLIDENV